MCFKEKGRIAYCKEKFRNSQSYNLYITLLTPFTFRSISHNKFVAYFCDEQINKSQNLT